MELIDALRTNDTETLNGMPAHSTTLNACLDLFSSIGAMRGQDKDLVINLFVKAFDEDPTTAMRILFWSRDVRGGSGERQIFKDVINYLGLYRPDSLSKNVTLIPEYGRWDDLFVLFGTKAEESALACIIEGLSSGNQLCAKWCPRPNTKNTKDKAVALAIRKRMKLSPKEYRKLLVTNTNVVEQLMCANKWSEIEYSKIPSKAMSDYMATFAKRDINRYSEYLGLVTKGEATINTGAIYPYNVVNALRNGDVMAANTMWANLPDYMTENNERLLPVVDVSGSMVDSAGGSKTISCMDVAISLGLYISERNVGQFKDAFITFSRTPSLQYVKGTLQERYNQMASGEWCMNTNLDLVFDLILTKAKTYNLTEAEMPTMVLIFSDMQFDSGIRYNDNAQDMIAKQYEEAGYKLPKIVYWNINDYGNKPIQSHQTGACLVSGFSPSLLTSILSGETLSPIRMMLKVVNSDRYLPITV
jgi:hypothetical protein